MSLRICFVLLTAIAASAIVVNDVGQEERPIERGQCSGAGASGSVSTGWMAMVRVAGSGAVVSSGVACGQGSARPAR